ncbi:MAG: hypothetical protein C0497_06525 [Gemmatimonas sp.]|nr:hypothetical protein [Gemmatimonas sp.]
MAPDSFPDPIAVAISFSALLERLGISYLIGGSFASSIHGEPRSTNDIDVVADIRAEHVPLFVELLGQEYYVSAEAMEAAVRSEGTFNVIHVDGGIKVDVFVAGHDAFNQERLRFREPVLPLAGQSSTLYVDTAEHSILRKLEWFRRGDDVSERQWRDVVGILRVQGNRLDVRRLRDWAARLGVSDLLERAFRVSEGEGTSRAGPPEAR